MFNNLYLLKITAKQLKLLAKRQREIRKLKKEINRLCMVDAENFVIKTSFHELENQNREFTLRWIECRDELKKIKELKNV